MRPPSRESGGKRIERIRWENGLAVPHATGGGEQAGTLWIDQVEVQGGCEVTCGAVASPKLMSSFRSRLRYQDEGGNPTANTAPI